MLFCCLPGPTGRMNKAKRAKEQLTEEYKDLFNLGQLMALIIVTWPVLSFTEQAQSVLIKVYDIAQKGMETDAFIKPDLRAVMRKTMN